MYSDRLAEAAVSACGGRLFIWGGDGEREPDPKGGEPDPKGGDGDADDDANDDADVDGDKDDDDKDDGDKDDKKPSLQDQLDELKRENISLKRSNDQFKAGKKKSDVDKDIAKERDEVKAENADLKGILSGKFLAWSIQLFAGSDGKPKYDWIDIDDVVSAIDQEAINIDLKTGKIEGLDLELKRIAKKKSHWLKKSDDDESDGGGSSGSHPAGGGVNSDEAETRRIGAKFKIPGFGSQAVRPV